MTLNPPFKIVRTGLQLSGQSAGQSQISDGTDSSRFQMEQSIVLDCMKTARMLARVVNLVLYVAERKKTCTAMYV